MANKQTETSLLTEHLKYTPLTLLDEIINSINDLSARAVDGAEGGLLAADGTLLGFADKATKEGRPLPTAQNAKGKPIFPELRPEIEEGVHQLETLLEANIDKNFDKFEIIVLRSILAVPSELVPWIRLAHYDVCTKSEGALLTVQDIPTTASTKSITPEELQTLRQKVQETRKLKNMLQATVQRNDETLKQLKALASPVKSEKQKSAGQLSFLASGSSATQLGITYPPAPLAEGELGPLSTNVSFALAQLPALKQLLAELKPQLTSLSKSSTVPAAEGDIARERRYFVETQSLKAMERQGLTTGTGSAESLGRVVSVDEMTALEALVDNTEQDDMDT
jgi:kinetochore protein Mis12/MTW1